MINIPHIGKQLLGTMVGLAVNYLLFSLICKKLLLEVDNS